MWRDTPQAEGKKFLFPGALSTLAKYFLVKIHDVGQICHQIGLLLVTGMSLAPTGVPCLSPVGKGSQSRLTGPSVTSNLLIHEIG